MFNSFVVQEGFVGLHFKNGRLIGTLGPGRHRFFGSGNTVAMADKRTRTYTVGGQDLTTLDGAMLRVTAIAQFRLVDPALSYRSGDSTIDTFGPRHLGASNTLHAKVQIAMREWTTVRKFADAYQERAELGPFILAALADYVKTVGIEMDSVELLDFSPSGGLKSAMADLVKAEVEGQAALARARNEAATMRSLLNTARLVREHPKLLELRVLAANKNPRVTFVIQNDEVSATSEPIDETS